jgi:hypothetical protein
MLALNIGSIDKMAGDKVPSLAMDFNKSPKFLILKKRNLCSSVFRGRKKVSNLPLLWSIVHD